jgi:hypothetical protein
VDRWPGLPDHPVRSGAPLVHALARYAGLGYLPAVLHYGHSRLIALVHDAEMQPARPTSSDYVGIGDEGCQQSPGGPLQPAPGSTRKDQPEPCKPSGDAGMSGITRSTIPVSAPGGIRTPDPRIRSPFRATFQPLSLLLNRSVFPGSEGLSDGLSLINTSRQFSSSCVKSVSRPACAQGPTHSMIRGEARLATRVGIVLESQPCRERSVDQTIYGT